VRRLDMAGRPEFLQVMATNLPQLSDVLPTERTGVPGLVAVVPIRDAGAILQAMRFFACIFRHVDED